MHLREAARGVLQTPPQLGFYDCLLLLLLLLLVLLPSVPLLLKLTSTATATLVLLLLLLFWLRKGRRSDVACRTVT